MMLMMSGGTGSRESTWTPRGTEMRAHFQTVQSRMVAGEQGTEAEAESTRIRIRLIGERGRDDEYTSIEVRWNEQHRE